MSKDLYQKWGNRPFPSRHLKDDSKLLGFLCSRYEVFHSAGHGVRVLEKLGEVLISSIRTAEFIRLTCIRNGLQIAEYALTYRF